MNLFRVQDEPGKITFSNVMEACLEVRSISNFEALVEQHDESWYDNIHIYKDYSREKYGREQFSNRGLSIPDS